MPYLASVALVLGCMSVFITPLAQAGSFIIELTNGRELLTSHVWEEGDEVKFYASQGTAGIPKALVKRIRTADRVRHDQVSRSTLAPSASDSHASTTDESSARGGQHATEARQAGAHGASQQNTPASAEARRHQGEANAYREQKARLMSQLDEANKTYLAASGARNPDAKKAALEEMRGYSKQFYALADEVKAKHGGTLPAWWND
jgi:hypothetical protein